METMEQVKQAAETQLQEEKKKKKWLLPLLLLLLALLIGAGVAVGILLSQNQQPQSKFDLDRNALAGFLPGRTEAEIQAELNRMIDESRLNVSMNPTPVLKNGKMNVMIENVPANHYYLQVDIFVYPDENNLEKTEKIYESGIIQQGFYIENADASTTLPKGEYNGIAYFHALYPETLEEIGQTGMGVVVTVE